MQIAAALRAQVAAGVLLPGERVPSTRHLASQLGISRGSVVTAYDQLT
ncbi:GntR family transcriptional regulator, partial [Pseudomonas sp. PNPG3]|nr:GntR family transcriptional regulator [Pseudomonas sp. PNPG3]